MIIQGNVWALVPLYKDIAAMIIGIAFLLAGLATLRAITTDPSRARKAIISYVVSLIVFILIWQLL
ncbi:hypothetical protein [Bacteroides pyogenes]|jgi:hypothetical protein|uniref:Uncharacterized protein n=1 Tax=Bacteroides pyogenes TaxID=310300 RepID=A0A5D3ECM7_9BACE|nr:hypothetical protein [Bacteroides pyogenes]TYK32825.1 hypothetical protein FNJ60_10465 [Bacteroides pyogenes]